MRDPKDLTFDCVSQDLAIFKMAGSESAYIDVIYIRVL